MNYLPFHEALEDCSRLAGKVPQASCIHEGDFPIIGQGKQAVEGFTNDQGLVFRGDLPVILFGDHTAAFKFIDRPFARGADGTKLFRPRTEHLDAKFAWHFLQTVQLPQSGYDRKTKYLENVEIPLLPLEEQRRIAAILDKADQLLGQSRLLIKEVPSVEQSIFESLFGEFVNGSSAYPVKALEEIVKENRIGLVRASTECGSDLPYAYLKMDAIGKNGRLLLHKAIKTRASSEELAAYSVRDGDVLFNTRNSRELVGKTAVYRGADEMLFNNNLMRLRFNPSTVSPDFFRLFLGSRQGASELESRKSGTTSVCAIYWKNLKTMPVPLPPYELQFQLAKSLENLERLTKKYFRQEAHCNDLSKVLKSDLMSGSH